MADLSGNPSKQLLKSILSNQKSFNDGLKPFMENVIAPILLKDTTFKRHFLAAPAVAVSFNLLQQIYEACHNFSTVLSAAENESGPKVMDFTYYTFPPLLLSILYFNNNRWLKLLHKHIHNLPRRYSYLLNMVLKTPTSSIPSRGMDDSCRSCYPERNTLKSL